MSKQIGSLIADKRESKGLSRDQLAKKAKVSTGYLSHIEANHLPITEEVAGRIAKALGTRISSADLEKHNDKARKSWAQYRNGLKAKSKRKASKPSSVQATLPGFSEMAGGFNIAERVAELVAQALMKGQQQRQEEETFNVTPIFKKVK